MYSSRSARGKFVSRSETSTLNCPTSYYAAARQSCYNYAMATNTPLKPRRFRKLRIAWSVWWGGVAVLLVALWVRSYWWVEAFAVPVTSKHYVGAASQPGCIGFAIHPMGNLSSTQIKRFQRFPTERWLEDVRQERLPDISRVWGTFDFRQYSFIAPDWFFLVVLTALAALPWVRWRFSLRTLLIATTLVAVVLGLVVWVRH